MADLTALLTHASSHDPNVRVPAEAQLTAFREANAGGYFSGLVSELANESKELSTRQLAGLILKNALTSKNEAQAIAMGQRWLALDANIRNQVKNILLQTLGSQHKVIRSTAALVIAKIAAIEVPNNAWNELVGTLVNNITKSTVVALRQASFETLGYVCEEVPDSLQAHSNSILNAISTGMKKEETNNDIKLAATIALANSLEFARDNFANQNERNLIMTMVFTSTQSEDEKVRIAAYQCLLEIAGVYYDYLAPYMNDIFRLTANAIQNEQDGVAQQAIEFWSTICDEEMAIQNEISDAETRSETYDRQNFNLAKQALTNLIPLLLNTLLKQSEDPDDDTRNAAQAAGTCLGLMAQTTQDHIVPFVLPWVQTNIVSPNWRHREAATLAFGCILDGPDRTKLAPLVKQAFGLILKLTQDQAPIVRDTAAWTIGRVCDLIPETISATLLPNLVAAFLAGLKDIPKVASNVCWAILNLASKAESDNGDTSPLSQYFEPLVRSLLEVTQRQDSNEANLLTSAYEAINELINTAAADTFHLIQQLVPTLIQRLSTTLVASGSSGHEREKINEVQAALCSALYMVVQKLQEQVVTPNADTLMTLFLRVLQSKNATVHEEALMAIAAIATVVNRGFIKYLSAFKPFLIIGLANAQEHRVCQVAVGVVGDLTRALEEDFIPISDDVMKLLLEHLQNNLIERSVKPHIFSCMGDIALAVGPFFERYMVYVMRMLDQASTIKAADLEEDEKYDYLNELRTSILEAYTGILQGLGEAKQSSFTATPQIMNFVDTIVAEGANKNEDVLRAAVGLVGDIGSRLGSSVAGTMNRPSVAKLIQEAESSDEETTKEVAIWTRDVLRSLGLQI